jgi:cytochrome c-type biogenesis protein CcmH/NrfG
VQAARLQPDNPETWIQLAGYDLAQHQPGRAVVELARAKTLYRGSAQIASELSRAQAETSHPMR